MGDFGTEGSVIHEKNIEVFHVAHNELLEPIRQMISGLFVRAVTDFGHGFVSSESAPHPIVDALISV